MKNKQSSSFILLFTLSCLSGMAGEPQMVGQTDTSVDVASSTGFGGPNSVQNQQDDDASITDSLTGLGGLESYFNWKDHLREQHGFSYTLDYTSGALAASSSLSGRDFYASGALRFYGSWDLIGRESGNTGTFIWKAEHRHGHTTPAYNGAAADMGYAGALFGPLSDSGPRLTNLYWKQLFNDGRIELIAGMIDTTDWVDLYALASPWNGFTNFSFGTGSATIGVPDDAALGAYFNAMLTDNFYLITGFADANADSTDPFNGFDTFFNDNEYFKSIELGWTTSQERFYLDNAHVTLWHVDERNDAGVSDGWGANFSYSHSIGTKWMYFLRGGYAEDGGSLFQKSISTGAAYHLSDGISLVGLGLNWSEPNQDTFGPALNDQYALELFTRLRLTRNLEVIPNINLIGNPALNPDKDSVVSFGLRARVFF